MTNGPSSSCILLHLLRIEYYVIVATIVEVGLIYELLFSPNEFSISVSKADGPDHSMAGQQWEILLDNNVSQGVE